MEANHTSVKSMAWVQMLAVLKDPISSLTMMIYKQDLMHLIVKVTVKRAQVFKVMI